MGSFDRGPITAYLDAGGTIENAQAIAAHESPRTTKLYDRTGEHLTLDEIERISIRVGSHWIHRSRQSSSNIYWTT